MHSHDTYQITTTGFGEHSDARVKWTGGLEGKPQLSSLGGLLSPDLGIMGLRLVQTGGAGSLWDRLVELPPGIKGIQIGRESPARRSKAGSPQPASAC